MITPPPALPGARELFVLDRDVAYLNHGSFGAVPWPVRAERSRLIDEHDANPMRFVMGLQPRLDAARRELATFLGADANRSALVPNATVGTALVLNGFDWAAGDEIVVTDHGYQAVSLAVMELRDRYGVRVVTAPIELGANDEAAIDAVLACLTERTRLVIVDQISSATAQRHPVEALAERLREHGVPLLVDGAHAPGQLPAAAAVSVDFWVGNLHKWAFAPMPTALLHVGEQWRDRIRPLVVSHGQPDGFPHNVEHQGSSDFSTWLSAAEGAQLYASFGESILRDHNVRLAAYGQQIIAAKLGLTGPLPDPGPDVSMRVIPLPAGAADDEAGVQRLYERISKQLRVEVAINAWRGRGLLRVSAQIYNRPEDYQRLADGLPDLL